MLRRFIKSAALITLVRVIIVFAIAANAVLAIKIIHDEPLWTPSPVAHKLECGEYKCVRHLRTSVASRKHWIGCYRNRADEIEDLKDVCLHSGGVVMPTERWAIR